MKTQSNRNVRSGIEWTLGAFLVGSLGGAQSLAIAPTPLSGNLSDDVRPGRPATEIDGRPRGITKGQQEVSLEGDMIDTSGGMVFDGGTIYVDVMDLPGLTLGVQVLPIDDRPRGIHPPRRPGHVVLGGGTPGNAGVIVVSNEPPRGKFLQLAGSAVIAGTFGMDGSFVVELPTELEDVWVQGVEIDSQIGHGATGALHVGAAAGEDELSWQVSPLGNDVRGILNGLQDDQRTKIRFQGAAGLGDLRGPVEFTVEIGPSHGGFVVVFDGPLGQASATAGTTGIRRVAWAASPADLVEALASASSLSALQHIRYVSGAPEAAARALASLRAKLQTR